MQYTVHFSGYNSIHWKIIPVFIYHSFFNPLKCLKFSLILTLLTLLLTYKRIVLDKNIVATFRGMHVSPAKHSYAWLPRKCDYRTDGQTDAGQSDPYVPLCFAGDTIKQYLGYHWPYTEIVPVEKAHRGLNASSMPSISFFNPTYFCVRSVINLITKY